MHSAPATWLKDKQQGPLSRWKGGLEGGSAPTCVAGERACPPEDCGGIHGYYDLLARLRDPGSDDDEEARAWIEEAAGGPFDPDAFDLEAVNRALKRLR